MISFAAKIQLMTSYMTWNLTVNSCQIKDLEIPSLYSDLFETFTIYIHFSPIGNQVIGGLQPIPRDSKDKEIFAMLDEICIAK